MQYNLHAVNNKWIETLATETEAAINLINTHEQQYYKYLMAKSIEEVIEKTTKNNHRKVKHKQEWKTIKTVAKIAANDLIIMIS